MADHLGFGAALAGEVLGEPRFRERARELGAALTAAGGTTTAGELVDALLAGEPLHCGT